MTQLSIDDALNPQTYEDIHFEIQHRHGERKTVRWVATLRGFILADGFCGHELRFRSKAGTGVGIVKDWTITKAELARLRNAIEAG